MTEMKGVRLVIEADDVEALRSSIRYLNETIGSTGKFENGVGAGSSWRVEERAEAIPLPACVRADFHVYLAPKDGPDGEIKGIVVSVRGTKTLPSTSDRLNALVGRMILGAEKELSSCGFPVRAMTSDEVDAYIAEEREAEQADEESE